jgi:CRP/FNR family cyclic AMP-dependent transcriptional regulator
MAATIDTSEASSVRLLEADPELGAHLAPDDFEQASRYAVVQTVTLSRGVHDPGRLGHEDMLGLIVLDGLLIRSVQVAQRSCGELVGRGALLRPWDHFGHYAPMPFDVRWRVLEPVTVALLDQRIYAVGQRWPGLMHGIFKRAIERSHTLALNVAIHCLQHVDLRLLVLMWHLADRYGRVTPQGTVVPLKLSHTDLAELVGSHRPSVSARLGDLRERGQIERRADGTWLLVGEPPSEIRDMRVRADQARAGTIAAATAEVSPFAELD